MFVVYLFLLLYAVMTAVTINLYLVAWYDYVNFQYDGKEGGWRGSIRPGKILSALFLESIAVFFHFITRPLRLFFDRRSPLPDAGGRPVLLIHGWGSSSHAFMLIFLYLKKMGMMNVSFMTYRPITADMARLSRQVAERIDEVLARSGSARVSLVAHSMGGVLCRYAIKNLGVADKVERVITLGTPHMGTRTTAFSLFGKNTLQLSYNSRFMKELAEGGMTPGSIQYTSIYSNFDGFIVPQDSAVLEEPAIAHRLCWHGHVRLLYSGKVKRLIHEALKAGEARGQYPNGS
jgi:triacylglycerol esterase/lipase EstA (alpha/beta hydrolase family)